MKIRKLLTSKEAESHFRVCGQTLRLWDKAGKIETERTIGGWRRYWVEVDVPDIAEPSNEEAQAELDAKRKEIEAKLALYRAHLGKDTLLGRVAETSIPSLERELSNLS